MNELLSVIIPVYNCKKYLDECIQSVLSQSYSELEIILVDDGSTDESGRICDAYAMKYAYIQAIHTTNQGQLLASETGLRYSNGKYILFVDSDDWIEREMCKSLVELMEREEADVVTSGIIRHDINGEIQNRWVDNIEEGKYEKSEDIKMIRNNLILGEKRKPDVLGGIMDNKVCKLFNRELVLAVFEKIHDYVEQIKIDEDFLFSVIYFLQCHCVVITHQCFYHYRYNPFSMVNNYHIDYLENKNWVWKAMKDALQGLPDEEVLMEQLKKRFFYTVCNGMNSYMGIDPVPRYCFDDYQSLLGKRVVLFGAGKVGRDFYKLFQKQKINIVKWVDSDLSNKDKTIVFELSEIQNVEYDVIVCGVLNKEAADNMKKQLIELGVKEKQIVWEEPTNWLYQVLLQNV